MSAVTVSENIYKHIQLKVAQIDITYRDRFIRTGFEWFQSFAKHFGTKTVVFKQVECSPQEELIRNDSSVFLTNQFTTK